MPDPLRPLADVFTDGAEERTGDAASATRRRSRSRCARRWPSDPGVFCLGEDVGDGGAFGATQGLRDEFGPARVLDTPISESAIVGFAVGAAVAGLRPVVEIMHMDFIACAMDQIVNQAAKVRYMFGGKARVPMVIRPGPAAG